MYHRPDNINSYSERHTNKELIWKIVKTLPSGYKSMYIIADTYRETSIKSSEQEKRGSLSKIFIKSASTMFQ